MKETVIQVRTELEKVTAIRVFLSARDIALETELADFMDALYKKYVPMQVRDYIERADALEEQQPGTAPSPRVTACKPASGDPGAGGGSSRRQEVNGACRPT